jgi:hypothetical protein
MASQSAVFAASFPRLTMVVFWLLRPGASRRVRRVGARLARRRAARHDPRAARLTRGR